MLHGSIPFWRVKFHTSWTQTHGLIDLNFPLKDHTSFLGPIIQKSLMLPCSLGAPFNICCNCCELYWLLGHKVNFLIPFFLVMSYSVHVKQIMASCILLYFPSHSCFLLCNVIVILLQCIILHLCTIFVINSSCCFWLSLDMLYRTLGLLCSVQESTREIEIQMWQKTSTVLCREDGFAMVLITNSPFVSSVPLFFIWLGPENKDAGNGRCLWHGLVLKMWEYSCAVLGLTWRSCRRSQWLLLKMFGLIKRIDLKYLSFSFSEKFKEKMSLHILRRWGDGGRGVRCL